MSRYQEPISTLQNLKEESPILEKLPLKLKYSKAQQDHSNLSPHKHFKATINNFEQIYTKLY